MSEAVRRISDGDLLKYGVANEDLGQTGKECEEKILHIAPLTTLEQTEHQYLDGYI